MQEIGQTRPEWGVAHLLRSKMHSEEYPGSDERVNKKTMSRMHKKINWNLVQEDRENIIRAGYKITVKSPYHWHVRRPGSWQLVNVWPTAHKIMQAGSFTANPYIDPIKALNNLFDLTSNKAVTQKANEVREGGLDAIKKLLKN